MKRDRVYLLDILSVAKAAVEYIGGKPLGHFLNDPQCQDAVIRKIVIVGEAANRVSKETRTELPLPWKDMIGMRNLLIHNYDDVDMTVVYKTVIRDLALLVGSLEKVVKDG